MIVIIDYGMGNTASISNMIKYVGGEAVVSSDQMVVKSATGLILPGVGAFDNAVKKLGELGLYDIIKQKVDSGNTSLLGICLGMQLLFDSSEEGVLPGFGFIPGDVKHFTFKGDQDNKIKIPHIGWNTIIASNNEKLFAGIENPRYYFVHSYHSIPSNKDTVIATCLYGYSFVSAARLKNIIGVQFHPEKSHKFGMQFFKNYLKEFQ